LIVSSGGRAGLPQPTVILTSLTPAEDFIGMHCRQSLTEFPGRAGFSAGGRQTGQAGAAAG
jgi:hypothetical protein